MKHLFLPHQLAITAKQKGFNEPCLAYYHNEVIHFTSVPSSNTNSFWQPDTKAVTAPLYQQVLEWLRDKHQLFIDIHTDRTSSPKFCFEINAFTGNPKNLTEKEWGWEQKKDFEWFLYRTYNETLNNAIEQAFKLIK